MYTKKDLVKYFLEFNKCKGVVVDSNNNSSINKKIKFNYSVLIGFSSLNFETSTTNDYVSVNLLHKFDQMYSYPFGGEVEMNLPINNNKWALYFQPTYQGFNANETVAGQYGPIRI